MMENVSVGNTCYDTREKRDKVAATYLSLAHISCACATNTHKKNSASFDLQKASLSYDCSDFSAICVEEVLL